MIMNWKLKRSPAVYVTVALLAMMAAVICTSVRAQTTSGFIRLDNAQRAMQFGDSRRSAKADGTLLVCPYDADISLPKFCTKAGKDAWIPMMELQVPGYHISGFEIIWSSDLKSQGLVVFWAVGGQP
jgi:hypothetical protein